MLLMNGRTSTRGFLPPAVLQRLKSDPRMIVAVRSAVEFGSMAAETEIFAARISDRPPAGPVRQHEDVHSLAFWNMQVDESDGFRLRFRPKRRFDSLHRLQCRCSMNGQYRPSRVRRLARPARPWSGSALWRHPARKAKPVNLADHCVACDAMRQPARNLASAEAFVPKFLEHFDPVFRPGQFVVGSGWVRIL